MNHFRKFLAMALAALMLIGATVSVSAKKFDDVANDNIYAEQIDLLSEIGVIVGTSANEFSPNEPVTREQMALLLYRMMIGNDNAGSINTSPFNDLYDPTYHGAISWASANRLHYWYRRNHLQSERRNPFPGWHHDAGPSARPRDRKDEPGLPLDLH